MMSRNHTHGNPEAEELSRMLRDLPSDLSDLNDLETMADKVETLMPLVSTFTRYTCDLLEQGKHDEAQRAVRSYAAKFAEGLGIPIEYSLSLWLYLLLLTMMVRRLRDALKVTTEKKSKRSGLAGLWKKEK